MAIFRTFLNDQVRFGLVFVAVIAFAGAGCGKKVKPDDESAPTALNADAAQAGDSDSGQAMGLQSVNFPFDAFVLDAQAKGILKSNAAILKDNSSVKVQIEGHCDERGGIQYNLALGEKRANAVRKFMADLGISEDRLTTISFGEERPLDAGHSEEAWAKNRRANFVITSK